MRPLRRLAASLAAGAIAIVLNTLALNAADLVALPTARGGLLRLSWPWIAPLLQAVGLGTPLPSNPSVQVGFHLVVGLLMAVFYAFLMEPWLPGAPFWQGVFYAVAVWLLNAAVVLPLTGEGFAGSAHLTVAGVLWFAAAHTLFFVLMAVIYARLRGGRG